MKTVALGSQGLSVSEQGLGCMGMSEFYGVGDDTESIATLHRALDLGVTFLDTADIYGNGVNERLVGKAIAGRRDEVVLATKFGIVRPYDIRNDFFAKLVAHDKKDKDLAAAIERAQELIGYPDDGKDRLVNEVVIKRRSAGAVIWGFNGWAIPPRNLAPS